MTDVGHGWSWVGHLVVGALLFEATVRAILLQPGMHAYVPCAPMDSDALCDLGSYLRLQGSGAVADQAHHPLYGHTVFPDRVPHDDVNEQGVRALRPIAPEPEPGRTRVMLLGDSFVFGSEVPHADTYVARLEETHPHLDIVNLGVASFGNDGMLLRYREEGRAFHPDIVVVGTNGLMSLRDGLRRYLGRKSRFVVRDGELELTGVPVPPASERFRSIPWRPWSPLVVAGAARRVGRRAGESGGDWAVTGRILETLVAEVRADGAIPVVAFVPTLSIHFDARGPLHGEYVAWRGWCARSGAPRVDLSGPLQAVWRDGVDTRRGGHWNRVGHDLYAETLGDMLDRVLSGERVPEL